MVVSTCFNPFKRWKSNWIISPRVRMKAIHLSNHPLKQQQWLLFWLSKIIVYPKIIIGWIPPYNDKPSTVTNNCNFTLWFLRVPHYFLDNLPKNISDFSDTFKTHGIFCTFFSHVRNSSSLPPWMTPFVCPGQLVVESFDWLGWSNPPPLTYSSPRK